MKALFIANNEESSHAIKKLMDDHFPNIELEISTNSHANLIDLMTLNGPFSFILIDLDNQNINIDEIYSKILATLGLRPFVFIGSRESIEICISEEISQQTNTNFIVEISFDLESLEKFKIFINRSIEWIKQEDFEESVLECSKDELQQIRLRNFYLFEQMPYDVYIELTSNKFGKVINKNKVYSHRLIQTYARKHIKHLYLKKNEHLMFLDASVKNLLKIYANTPIHKTKSMALHLKTIFFIHEFIKVASASNDIIKLTIFFIESCHEIIRSKDNMIELIDQLSDNLNMTFAEHSLATAYICESILYYMGWSANLTRGRLILASILQNITLSNDEMIKITSLNDPHYKTLSEEDQLEFQNHPLKSAQTSAFFNGFSDIDFILSEHHEHPSGDGFPNELNSSSLTTISCIFILANNFVTRVAASNKAAGSYEEIIKYMRRIYNIGNFKDPLKALEKSVTTLKFQKSQ